jgi:hypothetical protein
MCAFGIFATAMDAFPGLGPIRVFQVDRMRGRAIGLLGE